MQETMSTKPVVERGVGVIVTNEFQVNVQDDLQAEKGQQGVPIEENCIWLSITAVDEDRDFRRSSLV